MPIQTRPLRLKALLAALDIRQVQLARHLRISSSAVSLLTGRGQWPKTAERGVFKHAIGQFLAARGASAQQIARAFTPARDNEASPDSPANLGGGAANRGMAAQAATSGPQGHKETKEQPMLLRKSSLAEETRRHFKIARDPFGDEIEGAEDVFLTDDIRHVRAAMRQTVRHGGMLAVVGESGAGKSTLRQDLQDWVSASGERVVMIEPCIEETDDSERKGKILKAADITDAIIGAVAPGERARRRLHDRGQQLREVLKASRQAGNRHVLLIEEAHALAVPTLKHLKRFYELQDGFKRLLSIILLGQTELDVKLSEHNPQVREVVQRCEVVHLPPLDNHIETYLRHKLARVQLDFDALIDKSAVDEIRSRLRYAVAEGRGGARQTRTLSLCYPQAIGNLVRSALNEAVKIGAPRVTGPIIAAAARAREA